jgi:membrane protein implicated in regulation of membrane protease activity
MALGDQESLLAAYDWAAWVGLAVLLGVIEVTTLDLLFLMLAGGALAGAGSAALGAPFVLQVVIALVTAVAMLGVVRPVALRHLQTPSVSRTGVAALVGAKGVVLERVDAHSGLIKLAGETWSARSFDPHTAIEPGTAVDVMQIDGATAVVYESEL